MDLACDLIPPTLPPPLFSLSLSATELQNRGQRRDALRLLVLLLPQANRDTLHQLLQFLSRVALHSDGIILIDGTEVCGCVSIGGTFTPLSEEVRFSD